MKIKSMNFFPNQLNFRTILRYRDYIKVVSGGGAVIVSFLMIL